MNGAEKLLESLVASGVEVCFSNPGTSEMQLVSAIGNNRGMRAILCLFEGVVSGAADGYGRMADKPAITLLHVGSGFSNSMANLHNAKRAHSPVVNIVGDHATYHLQYDAPLTSDVPAHAAICSEWVKVSVSADDLALSGRRTGVARRACAAVRRKPDNLDAMSRCDCSGRIGRAVIRHSDPARRKARVKQRVQTGPERWPCIECRNDDVYFGRQCAVPSVAAKCRSMPRKGGAFKQRLRSPR